MDAPEDDLDIKLQKVSDELIAAFDQRLETFLRTPHGPSGYRVRSRVRAREATHLTSNVLDPFQELPQLLDPHLPKWLPMLAEAFLEYLQMRRRRARDATATSSLLIPLPTAICKLIYTFCKLRGEKVIVRFLNVETKYLELLLSALEDAERHQKSADATLHWTWEERYVVLLWLSHLMFAPFDLSTISSVYMEDVDLAGVPGFFWPSNIPGITVRILPIAVKYLASPGKERDAAKALLVRMAMRRDMQQLGVLHALVQWALFWLRPRSDEPAQSPYKYIGVLSFLAGTLASSTETTDMEKYLSNIFNTVNAISSNDDEMSRTITSSALAKKAILKIMRSISVSKLKRRKHDTAGIELVETTVGHLLERLADNDTPVRFAASKALSIVTLSLPGYMASEVIEAVLESLNKNVLWVKNASNSSLPPTRDLTSVDPLEWHGLMLTLSHLLYRRSPPVESLNSIVRALLIGLSFEKRGASGTSVGTNVRDAACFGIWALARRYYTQELLDVSPEEVRGSSFRGNKTSVLQILATDLVVTASLDPAGNIRRGSSAALQELIGRHPDTVEKGIAIVQAVDYHAVALRSRAIHDVAVSTTKLHPQYGDAILNALLGWRGTGDGDSAARRAAGMAYGTVMAEMAAHKLGNGLNETILKPMSRILQSIGALQTRQVEERHGLLLALASVIDQIPTLVAKGQESSLTVPVELGYIVEVALDALCGILNYTQTTAFRKPELIAESICRVLIAYFPMLQADAIGLRRAMSDMVPGRKLVSTTSQTDFTRILSRMDPSAIHNQDRLSSILNSSSVLIDTWLTRVEPDVINATSEASLILLIFSSTLQRQEIISVWLNKIRHPSRSGTGAGYFHALTKAYPIVVHSNSGSNDSPKTICEPLLQRWAQDQDIEVRVSILQSLVQTELLRQNVDQFLGIIREGLDDYTTNARGDVGSHVRLQAIKATKYLWQSAKEMEPALADSQSLPSILLLPILRLAAEKLDRVRSEAQSTLALALQSEQSSKFAKLTFSSKDYFTFLLNIFTRGLLSAPFQANAVSELEDRMNELLAGYVTSADTGNEDLVIASRAAITEHCGASQQNLDLVCSSLLQNLKARQGQDRVMVPTLEIISFLFSVSIFQRSTTVDMKSLCLHVQKSGYKSGNIRKLEACVKVYGGVASMGNPSAGLIAMASDVLQQKRADSIIEAKKRLSALLVHPWPRVRSSVVDELWGLMSAAGEEDKAVKLKGVDWGTAERASLKTLVTDLNLF